MSIHSSKGRDWTKKANSIKDRDGGTCQLQYGNCTHDQDLTVDHITAKVHGGTDDEWNLITACRSCNGSKGAKRMVRANWIRNEWFV